MSDTTANDHRLQSSISLAERRADEARNRWWQELSVDSTVDQYKRIYPTAHANQFKHLLNYPILAQSLWIVRQTFPNGPPDAKTYALCVLSTYNHFMCF